MFTNSDLSVAAFHVAGVDHRGLGVGNFKNRLFFLFLFHKTLPPVKFQFIELFPNHIVGRGLCSRRSVATAFGGGTKAPPYMVI